LNRRELIRHFCRERRGAVALEFAIIATVFLTLVLGAIELGLLYWTKNGLQLTAAMTARCVALGYSCTDAASTKSYATTMAESWVVPGVIGNVSPPTYAQQCYSDPGTKTNFAMVTITSSFWAWLPPPLSNINLQVSACYPVPS
jgi:hypothetical protein